MSIEIISKIAPKNDGFTGLVDAKHVIGDSGTNVLPHSSLTTNLRKVDDYTWITAPGSPKILQSDSGGILSWIDLPSSSGHIIELDGSTVGIPARTNLNFLSPFSVNDNVGNDSTDISITIPPGLAISSNNTPMAVEPILNFSTQFVLADNGGTTSTDVTLTIDQNIFDTTSFFIGEQTGTNPSGTHSVMIGYDAAGTNTPASAGYAQTGANVAVGYGAGTSAYMGHSTMVGFNAGLESYSTKTIMIGRYAGGGGTWSDSVLIGPDVGATWFGPYNAPVVGAGDQNVIIGSNAASSALPTASGELCQNTLIGVWSGGELTTGSFNTFIGNTSGGSGIIAGVKNTFIGTYADADTDVSNSIAIGYDALVTASNQLVIGGINNSNGAITDGYFGSGVVSATPGYFVLHATGATGTNIAGSELILAGGISTGTGVGGNLQLQVSPKGTTGSTPNTLITGLTVKDDLVGNAMVQIDRLKLESVNSTPGYTGSLEWYLNAGTGAGKLTVSSALISAEGNDGTNDFNIVSDGVIKADTFRMSGTPTAASGKLVIKDSSGNFVVTNETLDWDEGGMRATIGNLTVSSDLALTFIGTPTTNAVLYTNAGSGTLAYDDAVMYYDTSGGAKVLYVGTSDTTDGIWAPNITLNSKMNTSTARVFNDLQMVGSSAFQPQLRFYEDADNGSHYTYFKGAASIASTHGYILPAALPASNKVLQSDNGGNLSWVDSAAGGISWSVVTGATQAMTPDAGYIANNGTAVVFSLPTTCAAGKTVRVSGMNTATGWKITQAASQKIYFGSSSTTTGVAGYLESTAIRDAVELVCVVADLEFNVVSSIGNITIV